LAEIYYIYRSNEPYFDIIGMDPIAEVIENSFNDLNALAGGKYFYLITYEY
jgi:hypothetical protein